MPIQTCRFFNRRRRNTRCCSEPESGFLWHRPLPRLVAFPEGVRTLITMHSRERLLLEDVTVDLGTAESDWTTSDSGVEMNSGANHLVTSAVVLGEHRSFRVDNQAALGMHE